MKSFLLTLAFVTLTVAVSNAQQLYYKYYEGDWSELPDFDALIPIKTGFSNYGDLTVKNRSDHFGILWEGYINIPVTGSYTFETYSDDGSAFYIGPYLYGAPAVVNNDGLHGPELRSGTIHLAKGTYPIAIAYFDKVFGENLEVWWSSPDAGIARQRIPTHTVQYPPPYPNGLNFKYYEGAWDRLPDFETLTPVKTGKSSNADLSITNRDDHFAILWEGTITVPVKGYYTFETVSDEGSRLDIDWFPLLNNDSLHEKKSQTAKVLLSAGLHAFTVSYFENTGSETLELWWSSAAAGIPRQRIPDGSFLTNLFASNRETEATNGLNYRYYEGDWDELPDFNELTPVKTGNSANIDLKVANRSDHFGMVWEGTINLPYSGEYTFETNSDDGSKMYIGSAYSNTASSLVVNDGLHGARIARGSMHLEKGLYPIAITYFEKSAGELLEIWWSARTAQGSLIPRQQIPNSAFVPTVPVAKGLNYRYYEGDWNELPDFNALTPVKTGNSSNIDLGVRNRNDHFGMVWDGMIHITVAGRYTFETNSDEGSKLYLYDTYNHALSAFIDNNGLHGPQSKTAEIFLTPGSYPIAIAFFEKVGGELLEIWWSARNSSDILIQRQKIPDSAFVYVAPPPPPGALNFKYYEGDWDELPDFNAIMPLRSGTIPGVYLGVGARDNHFGVLWEGTITIPASGSYTFETYSDDGSKLYIGPYSHSAAAVVNNDGLHGPQYKSGTIYLEKGSYPFAATFFEKIYGQNMNVWWSCPEAGIPRQQIPSDAFRESKPLPPPTNHGLNYKYFEGDWNQLPDFKTLTPVKTGISANVDLGIKNSDDHFAVLWEGYIRIKNSGYYTFRTKSDDGSKIYIGSTYNNADIPLVNNDGLHGPRFRTGEAYLESGYHLITISYFEKLYGESMEVWWSGRGYNGSIMFNQQIPDSVFTTTVPMMHGEAAVVTSVQKDDVKAPKSIDSDVAFISQTITSNLKIFPNPFNESFNVSFDNPGSASKVTIEVFNLAGQLFYGKPFHVTSGANKLLVTMRGNRLKPGIYIARVTEGGKVIQESRLVKAPH